MRRLRGLMVKFEELYAKNIPALAAIFIRAWLVSISFGIITSATPELGTALAKITGKVNPPSDER